MVLACLLVVCRAGRRFSEEAQDEIVDMFRRSNDRLVSGACISQQSFNVYVLQMCGVAVLMPGQLSIFFLYIRYSIHIYIKYYVHSYIYPKITGVHIKSQKIKQYLTPLVLELKYSRRISSTSWLLMPWLLVIRSHSIDYVASTTSCFPWVRFSKGFFKSINCDKCLKHFEWHHMSQTLWKNIVHIKFDKPCFWQLKARCPFPLVDIQTHCPFPLVTAMVGEPSPSGTFGTLLYVWWRRSPGVLSRIRNHERRHCYNRTGRLCPEWCHGCRLRDVIDRDNIESLDVGSTIFQHGKGSCALVRN